MEEQKNLCDKCNHKSVCKHVEEFKTIFEKVEKIRLEGMPFRIDVYCKNLSYR